MQSGPRTTEAGVSHTPGAMLKDVLARHGRGVLDDQRRFEAILKDKTLPKAQSAALAATLKEKIPQRLLAMPAAGLTKTMVVNLGSEVSKNTGLGDDIARWAIEAWVDGLGLKSPESESKSEPDADYLAMYGLIQDNDPRKKEPQENESPKKQPRIGESQKKAVEDNEPRPVRGKDNENRIEARTDEPDLRRNDNKLISKPKLASETAPTPTPAPRKGNDLGWRILAILVGCGAIWFIGFSNYLDLFLKKSTFEDYLEMRKAFSGDVPSIIKYVLYIVPTVCFWFAFRSSSR